MEIAPESVIAEAVERPSPPNPPLPSPPLLSPAQRRRAVIAATTGNGLEFYDFVTFTLFAIQIGKTFFPNSNPFVSLMESLATFGVGFVTRPLGAYVLGGYADRHGRKPAMLISMTLMGAGIALLALTPGYARIGVIAPIAAVLARMIQGFALGGEVGSATIYMLESAEERRRGYAASWQAASQNISATVGALTGLLLSAVLTSQQLTDFGWRIALLLGVTIVPFALFLRHSLPETIEGVTEHSRPVPQVSDKRHWRAVICGFFAISSGTIATYIFHYMATFGQNSLGLSARASMAGQLSNNAISIGVALIGGTVGDRIGRRPVMMLGQGSFCLLIVPCFLWLTTVRDVTSFVGANLILSAAAAFGLSTVYAAISESLPSHVRARVFALVYSLPVCIFGGTTQMVVTWILHVTGTPMALAFYLTAVTALGLVAMILMRESAPVRMKPLTPALA